MTEPGEDTSLDGQLEAVLFSSDVPLTGAKLASLLGVSQREVLAGVDRLNVFYGEHGRAFRISPLAGGHQLVTVPEHATLLAKLHKERVPTRLSRAALETLSIIAFKQPVTRGEIDAIRGVTASDRVLRHLIERRLVRIAGRAEAPGRPLLYGTTREFLGYFGLSAVSDLPRTDELEALLAGDVTVPANDDPESATDDQESPEAEPGKMAAGAEEREDAAAGDLELAMMEDPAAGLESDESIDDDEPIDDEPIDGIEPAEESHSGEESDEHEGISSPQ